MYDIRGHVESQRPSQLVRLLTDILLTSDSLHLNRYFPGFSPEKVSISANISLALILIIDEDMIEYV